mmetsp:Transcript_18763/g.32064  ORF Transcript_18763/g.32064 Transcript_18763/m.32064 type:complete len:110 (+) Transcript_18763:652-981(+)
MKKLRHDLKFLDLNGSEGQQKFLEYQKMVLMRARKPYYQSYSKTCMLNFEGRVTSSSKKNIQIEYKSRLDNKIRVVLQHGAQGSRHSSDIPTLNGKIYSLDFTYPFTPL